MKNESFSDMWSELKSSKPKLYFFVFVMIVGGFGLITNGLDLAGLKAERISHSYDDVMREIYLSRLTTAQEAAKKAEFVGKTVAWQGTVIDVEPGSWGNTVRLSDGPHRALTDYYIEGVSDGDALPLSQGDVIRFSGSIDRIIDGTLTGYVYLNRATIE